MQSQLIAHTSVACAATAHAQLEDTRMQSPWIKLAALCFCALPLLSQARNVAPLQQGPYIAPMYSHAELDNARELDTAASAALAIGYRFSDAFALELYGLSGDFDQAQGGGEAATLSGASLGALAFLNGWLEGFYLPFAVGFLEADGQGGDDTKYDGLSLEAGLGYLLPLRIGDYGFALRVEARYRQHDGQDGRLLDEDAGGMQDNVFNLGLQLPFGLDKASAEQPQAAPVLVIDPCSDNKDNDGDGLFDYPDDPGCSSPTDGDETDLPQCADGRDNDGDGLIDFGADSGCASVSDNDEADPPCQQRLQFDAVSFDGCGDEDSLILEGVNFESDSAQLTPESSRILDQLAQVLTQQSDLRIHLLGYTDSRGRDEYNRNLSQRRAQAVLNYLVTAGVSEQQLMASGRGEANPIADNTTDDGRRQNRRVEVEMIGNN